MCRRAGSELGALLPAWEAGNKAFQAVVFRRHPEDSMVEVPFWGASQCPDA